MDAYVNVTGYVGAEIELRDTSRGHPCATFRIGTTPRIRRGGDWMDGETTWTTVMCYRGLAENVATSVRRGDAVIIVGKLRTQRWTGADQVEHERMVLEAATVGHDLTKGTATFHRQERQPVTSEDPLELAELILLAERKTELALAELDEPTDEEDEAEENAVDHRIIGYAPA